MCLQIALLVAAVAALERGNVCVISHPNTIWNLNVIQYSREVEDESVFKKVCF